MLVFDRTDSALTTAAVYALTFLPELIGLSWLPAIADRFPRRRVMIVCDVLRAAIVGAMAIPKVPLAVVCALLVIVIVVSRPFNAAEGALRPEILTGDRYIVASGLIMMTDQVAQLIGFGLGGIAIALIGARGGLGIDAATFLISAVLLALFVKRRPTPRAPDGEAARRTGRTRANVRLIRADPVLRILIPFGWLGSLFVAPEGVAAAYAATVGDGATRVGLLLASVAAGCAIGSFVLVRLIPISRQASLIGPLAIATGIPLIACALKPGLALSLLLWALSGALSAFQVIVAARIAQAVPAHRRAQIIGMSFSVLIAMQGLGVLAAGAVAEIIGARLAVAVAGAAGSALAIPLFLAWRRIPHSVAGRYDPRHRHIPRRPGTARHEPTSRTASISD